MFTDLVIGITRIVANYNYIINRLHRNRYYSTRIYTDIITIVPNLSTRGINIQ